MKKSAIATGLALAIASCASWAGGIQLDPTGSGSIGSSKFLSDASLGSSFGNLLAENILGTVAEQALGSSLTGEVYGHNAIGLGGFGIAGGELTIQFELHVLPAVTGTANTVGEQLSFIMDSSMTSFFRLYFDSTADANQASGKGYGANEAGSANLLSGSHLIASTSAISITGGTAALTNTSGGIFTPTGFPSDGVAQNNTTHTIRTSGSINLDMDFAVGDVDTAYVTNDLISLLIDLTTLNSLATPFPNVSTLFSALVLGHSLTTGADGINNFRCSGGTSVGACDFQANMNTTIIVPAQPAPEPTTLALIGAGLGLAGWQARRRSTKA